MERTRMWSHFHHEADIGVRGTGPTLAAAFEQAALALTAVITDPEKVACRETVRVRCTAPDPELLLVDWLNALVYEMATRHLLFSAFHVETDGTSLEATACGEPLDRARHRPAVEIKGATYTALAVREEPPGHWRAGCVVDV
jgi:tRNA nucleotidyltransferase (CCA-adding enzyme)